MESAVTNQQLLRLSLLLFMEKRLREASREELAFIIVNETSKIIRYQQAILWQPQLSGSTSIRAISGVSIPDSNSPFFLAIRQLLPNIKKSIDRLNQPDTEANNKKKKTDPHIL